MKIIELKISLITRIVCPTFMSLNIYISFYVSLSSIYKDKEGWLASENRIRVLLAEFP